RKRDRDGAVVLEAASDALADALQSQQTSGREPADRDDQAGADEAPLPVAPEPAELLLPGRGRSVAAAARRLARIAAGDGSAVEGRIELVLVEVEPAAQCPARTASPRAALFSFLHAR